MEAQISMKWVMKRGHELNRQMVGHYMARLALGLKQAWREAKNITMEAEKTMVELKGSEKQIKWAKSIREDFIKDIDRQIKRNERHLETTPYEDAIAELERDIKLWKAFKEKLENEESASWFIDNRNGYLHDMAGIPDVDLPGQF